MSQSTDTSYRQKRCRHGWVDEGQCEDCATAKRERLLYRAVCKAVGMMNIGDNGPAHDVLRQALVDYANATTRKAGSL